MLRWVLREWLKGKRNGEEKVEKRQIQGKEMSFNNYLDTDKASAPFWGFLAILVAMDLKIRRSAPSTGPYHPQGPPPLGAAPSRR